MRPASAREHSVLRPGSRFVFAAPHPAFDVVDPETGDLTMSYFDTRRRVEPDPSLEYDLVASWSTVGEPVTALVEAGCRLERLVEPGSPTRQTGTPRR